MAEAHRKLAGKIVIATHNLGKLREMRELLEPYGISAVSAGELNLPEPEETGTTFIANALIKARASAMASNLPAFADDSGLCVEALDGDPGIYSARWAKEAGNFTKAMTLVDSKMRERGATSAAQRRGYFVSALALAWPDGHEETFEAKVLGEIVWPPRGERGFGYDPFFLPDGYQRTFGEMDSHEKHGIPADGSQALSHRARAFQMLAKACLS
jgi:XTP/dITP diphosphohydrolase